MLSTKTWAWRALLLAALLGTPVTALAQGALTTGIQAKNLDGALRTQQHIILGFDADSQKGADVVAGTDGVVFEKSLSTAGAFISSLSITVTSTNLAPPPYPAKLNLHVVKASTGIAWSCTSFKLRGQDQFGRDHEESFPVAAGTTLSATTAFAYERVTGIIASGCTGTTGQTATMNMRLRISVTDFVGLPAPIRSYKDIISMCQASSAVTPEWDCLTDAQLDSATVDSKANTVDVTLTGYTVADGDMLLIRYRTPNW